jgi:negative regulator of sigma-B (phosphoserine phosphatase)
MSSKLLEWAVSDRPLPGEPVSGDCALVTVNGRAAVALVVDGVGHGPHAALAAQRALAAAGPEPSTDVAALAERCHDALRRTRGAAVGIAAIDAGPNSLTWLGIGNVEGRIVRAGRGRGVESLLLSPGVVGQRLPALRATTVKLGRGDLLLMATDGVGPDFAEALSAHGACDEIAGRVLAAHARAHDDALVLVLRYLGDG